MRKLLIILLTCLPLMAFAQSSEYYLYSIVSFEGKVTKEGVKVRVDDGKTVDKLETEKGKDIKFTTPAAALMYFVAQGWELHASGATTEGGSFAIKGTGGSDSTTTFYWILRKPCSKEEFDKAVSEAVKK